MGVAKEGIGQTLSTDRTCRSVSRVYPEMITEGKDLLYDTVQQGIVIPSGKIGPADGSGEQRVSGKNGAGCMNANPSGRMAGRMQYLHRIRPDADFLTVIEMSVRSYFKTGCIHGMYEQRGFRNPPQLRRTPRMVKMTMREKDITNIQFMPRYLFDDAKHLITRVDHDPFTRFLAAEDITIGLIRTDGQFSQHCIYDSFIFME